MTSSLDPLTDAFKALGHPARMRIVAMLAGGELCVCQITAVLGVAPSTASAHLAVLRRAGLITEEKRGRWVFYSLSPPAAPTTELLAPLWGRLARDPQIRADERSLTELRHISPVEEGCAP